MQNVDYGFLGIAVGVMVLWIGDVVYQEIKKRETVERDISMGEASEVLHEIWPDAKGTIVVGTEDEYKIVGVRLGDETEYSSGLQPTYEDAILSLIDNVADGNGRGIDAAD